MAFANLFTSIPNDVTSPCEPASFEREDGELEPEELDKDNEETNKSRNRSLLSRQPSASKMKKKRARESFSSALPKGPSKKVRDNVYFSDLDSRARDYHMKRDDNKQPCIDFSRELDNYNRVKLADQCSSQTAESAQNNGVQRKDASVQNEDNQQQQEKKKKKKKNKKKKWEMEQQSQTNWRGNPSERGGHQAHQSRHFSSMRGRGFANKGGQWADRGQDGSRKGSNSPREQQDGSKNGGGRKDQMGRFQNTNRFQRNGRGFRGGRRQFEQENVLERKRVMTQEFKDQNVIEKDGRFICRHFLLGKCIKGDECQLEHALDVHNIFKEACKFYIQGFCTKGTTCPYMHEDFPCKFFHSGGKCFQGDGCRFSHEPLTDLTRKLFEESWKQHKEMATGNQPENTEQETTKDQAMNTVDTDNPKSDIDIFLDPVRPNFYNSACPSVPDTEQRNHLWNTPEPAETKDNPHIDSVHTVDSSANTTDSKVPVSYSVEAVLGSRTLSDKPNPFNSLFANPVRQPSPGHWSQRMSPSHPSSSTECKEKVSYAIADSLGSQKMQEKPFRSLFARPIIEAYSSPRPLAPQTKSGTLRTHQSTEGSSHFSNSYSEECKTKRPAEMVGNNQPSGTAFQKLFARPIDQNSHSLVKKCADPPHSSQVSFSDKGGAKPSQDRSFLSLFAGPISQTTPPKCSTAPAQANEHPVRTQTNPRMIPSSQTHSRLSTDLKRKTSLSTESIASGKPLKKTFHSLFAGSIGQTSTAQYPTVPTLSGHEKSKNTPGPPPGSREIDVNPLKKPFHNLFSGLINPAPMHTPQTQNSPSSPIGLSDHKHEAPCSVEIPLESSKPVEKPFSSLFAKPIGEAIPTQSPTQTKPDFCSNQVKGRSQGLASHSEPAETKAVFKTLFQSLTPCRQEGKQSKDTVRDGFSVCKNAKQPPSTEKRKQKEDVRTDEDDTKSPVGCNVTEEPSLPDSISHEAVVEPRPSLKSQAQVGAPGFHNLPIQAVALLTRPPTNGSQKALSRQTRNESNVSTTQLKDLFKTFDPTASPFGQ